MRQKKTVFPSILLPEYIGSALIIHLMVLLLLFLALKHYQKSQQSQKLTSQPQLKRPVQQKKEPVIRMRRTPAVPNPVIGKEQESQSPVFASSVAKPSKNEETTPVSVAATPDRPGKPASPQAKEQNKKKQKVKEQPPEKQQPVIQPKTEMFKKADEPPATREPIDRPEAASLPPTRTRTKSRKTVPIRKKSQHSWYVQASQSHKPKDTTCTTTLNVVEDYASQYFETRYESSQKPMTPAEQVAERFNREFREAAVNDYITAVHHAIVFSLNRMRIMLAQDEIPALIVMSLIIDADGNLMKANVSIPRESRDEDNRTPLNLSDLIHQGIVKAAPFRPFPASLKKPTLDLTINAYPDFDTFAHTGNARTPLVFSIIGSAPGARRPRGY
jgi:hypothetical protein